MFRKTLDLIKEKLKIFIKKDIFFISLIILIMLFFTLGFFADYLQSKVIGGWDGQNHYAIVKYYSDNIFPEPFGWVFNWNAGMPWPLGYNPLFSYLMAFLFHLFSLDSVIIFKLFFILLTFLFPIVVYYISKRLTLKKSSAFFSAILASLFLITPLQQGVTIRSTFLNGLYPQFFATFLCLLWFYFFLKFDKNRWSYFFSVIFLTFVFLSNTHVSQIALIIFFSFFIVDIFFYKNFTNLKKYFGHIIFSIGLVAFWFIPYLSNSNYFPYVTLTSFPLSGFLDILGIGIILFVLGSLSILSKRKDIISLFLAFFFTVFIIVFPVKKFFPSLPLQPFRLIPSALLFLAFLIPALTEKIKNLFGFKKKIQYIIFLPLVLFLVIFIYFPLPLPLLNSIFILNSESQVIEYLKDHQKGRSIIEKTSATQSHASMAALAGTDTEHQTAWNVFRESSITSIFNAPLRNSFSLAEESFGVSCMLCGKKENGDFYGQSFLKHLKRAELYNVKYFVVNSYKMVNLMFETYADKFTLLKVFDPWSLFVDISSKNKKDLMAIFQERPPLYFPWYIFEYKKKLSNVEIPEFEPALLFTDLKTKKRDFLGEKSYNWLRMAEEWFFYADFKTILVHPNNLYLDKTKDLDKFKIAVIIDYKYENFEKAYQKLFDYTKENKLILFQSKEDLDPLLNKLRNSKNNNIVFLEKKENPREGFRELLDILNNFNLKYQENNIVDYQENKERIFIQTEKQIDKQKVFVKNAYFPLWEDIRGGEVYMASPAFQIVLTDSDEIELKFNKNKNNIFVIGVTVSLVSLFFLILFVLLLKYNLE